MKASKIMLSSVLVVLLVACLIPGSVLGDGPWDIDHGGGNETHGGGLNQDRSAAGFCVDTDQGGLTAAVDPPLVSAVIYSWLNQYGLTGLAERVLLPAPDHHHQKDTRKISKTRR